MNVQDGPGSGLDTDTLDGTDLGTLEKRIRENRRYAETSAAGVNDALSRIEGWVDDD